jgi:hypothetical protein
MQIIDNKKFNNNQYVKIDGKHFVGCSFEDCVVEYNGGEYKFTSCSMKHGKIKFVSRDRNVQSTLILFKGLGFVRKDAFEIPVPIDPDS